MQNTRPKCPNHHCEMDKTNERHIWICPISGARFEVETEDIGTEKKYDKFGNEMTSYKLIPLDGQGG